MNFDSDYANDLRQEAHACGEDALMEEWGALGVDRHMEIIEEMRASGSKDEAMDGAEAMESWFQETAEFYEHETIEELLAWLRTEGAGDKERMEVVSSGYDLLTSEVVQRFCPQPELNYEDF